jgi:cell division protein FtsB
MPNLPINFRRVLVFAGVILLILMVVDLNRRLEAFNALSRQADLRSAQATQLAQTQLALQTQAAFAASTEAVNEWARSEAGMAQEGDQMVVPLGVPGSDPLSTVEPTPPPTPLPNWREWWNLFFSE